MSHGYDSDAEDSFGEYQRSVRGRAKETLEELQNSLNADPIMSPSGKRHRRASRHTHVSHSGLHERSGSWSGGFGITEHADYTYGAAVDRLRSMLSKTEAQSQPKNVQFRSPSKYSVQTSRVRGYSTAEDSYGSPPLPRGHVPSSEEALPLLQNQTILLQQLENENKFIKEELSALKQRQKELVEENRLLHEELKQSVVHEILQGTGQHESMPGDLLEEINRHTTSVTNTTRQNFTQWKHELERLNALHGAKTKRLETQLHAAREDVLRQDKEILELRKRLRMAESSAGTEGMTGLCVRCAQNEAILPSTYANQKQTIDKLTRERDELVSEMMRVRNQMQELRQREEDAYQQVKKSVEMVEQAQLEQTQALIQREQVKEELVNLRARMEELTEEMSHKMIQERETVRKENANERQQLNSKLEELTETLTRTQLQLDKVSRDKVSLLTELAALKDDVAGVDRDFYYATDSLKVTITTAGVERDAALRQLKKAKQEMDRLQTDYDAEKEKLRTELQDVRRRMEKAEVEVIEAKEECIKLHSANQALEREVHIAKLARESIERTRSDDMAAIMKRAEQREEELNILLETQHNKHTHTTGEYEDMLKNQSGLVQRLREECRNIAERLESATKKYKEDNKNLKTQVDQLKAKNAKSKAKLGKLEEERDQQSVMFEKMRQKLKQLDSHSQHSGQQILDMLARESALLKDRHLLAGEIKFLREQLNCYNHHQAKHNSFRHHQVDDILNSVKVEQDVQNIKDLTPVPSPTSGEPPTRDHDLSDSDDGRHYQNPNGSM